MVRQKKFAEEMAEKAIAVQEEKEKNRGKIYSDEYIGIIIEEICKKVEEISANGERSLLLATFYLAEYVLIFGIDAPLIERMKIYLRGGIHEDACRIRSISQAICDRAKDFGPNRDDAIWIGKQVNKKLHELGFKGSVWGEIRW